MKFEKIKQLVQGIPYISDSNAKTLYDTIIQNRALNCLELGFAHGVASCYIAAALDELGAGKLVTVDLLDEQSWQKPSIEELLQKAGLEKYVEIHREESGYNWFLHDDITAHTKEGICSAAYDLCIIDGPKNWTIDSSAFFLADKLLKKEGWMIFDDYDWTYAAADQKRESTDGITHRKLSEAERNIPHIKEIFHLLVMQHPDYSNFKIQNEGDWAWAQKSRTNEKSVTYVYNDSYKDIFGKIFSKIKRLTTAKSKK